MCINKMCQELNDFFFSAFLQIDESVSGTMSAISDLLSDLECSPSDDGMFCVSSFSSVFHEVIVSSSSQPSPVSFFNALPSPPFSIPMSYMRRNLGT